jgi:hypothetical protein
MPPPDERATTRLYLVPVWLRGLAGLLGLAALVAAVSLVSISARGSADLSALLLTGTQVILDICIGGLFAYVAVTGLAPVHLLRSAGDSWTGRVPRFRLEPALQRYLRQLHVRHAQITECWILLQTVQGRASVQTLPQCWLLVFGPASLAEALRADWSIRRREVRLFVVDSETSTLGTAWGRPYTGTLADWQWQFRSDEVACFVCPADAGEQLPVAGDDGTHGAVVQVAERLWSRTW